MRTLDQTSLSVTDRTAIDRTAAFLRAQYPIEAVVLYGSKARGDANADSDIDLLVLTGHELDWRQRQGILRSIYNLQIELGVMLSLLIVPDQQWKTGVYQALPLHGEIERDGIAA